MNKQWNKDGLTRKKLENDFRIHEPFQVLEKNLSNLLARAFSKSSFLYHYQSLAILNEIKQTDTIGIEQSFILWQNENSPESNREITYLRNALYHKFSDWYQRLNHRIFRDSMSDLFLDMEKYNQRLQLITLSNPKTVRRSLYLLLRILRNLQNKREIYIQEIAKSGETDPSLAVLIAFLKNYQYLVDQFNKRWEAYPLFYVNQILKESPQKAIIPSAWFIAVKNNTARQAQLPKGTGIITQVPFPAQDIQFCYRTDEDYSVNDMKITSIHSLLLEKDPKKYPASRLGFVTSIWQKQLNDRIGNVPSKKPNLDSELIFENQSSIQAGLMIESPMLLLREGHRDIHITFGLEEDSISYFKELIATTEQSSHETGRVLNDAFLLELSTEKGWAPIYAYTLTFINENSFYLKFVLNEKFDPTTPCSEAHGCQTRNPVLRILMNTDAWLFPYSWVHRIFITSLKIKVHVSGMSSLKIYNPLGEVDASVHFPLFGLEAQKGSWFAFGNYEIAIKPIQSMGITLQWADLPYSEGGFYDLYQAYKTPIDNTTFKVEWEKLTDQKWVKLPESTSCLFNTKNKHTSPRGKLSEYSEIVYDKPFKNITVSTEEEQYQYMKAQQGFFRIRLTDPNGGFGQTEYRMLFADIMIRNSHTRKQTPVPKPPYNPMIESIGIGYSAEEEYFFNGDTPRDRCRIYHIHPLRQKELHEIDLRHPFPMVEVPTEDGIILFGIGNLIGNDQIRLFFEMAALKREIEKEYLPCVQWSFFNGKQWEFIKPGNLLSDTTGNLLNTGLVDILLPSPISEEMLDINGDFWLSAKVSCHTQNCSSIRNVYLNPVKARLEIPEEMEALIGEELESFTGLVSFEKSMPGLTDIYQIIPAKGGRSPETPEDMRLRITQEMSHRNRAVLPRNYEQITLAQFPEVEKVLCLPGIDSKAQNRSPIVTLVVMQKEKDKKILPLCEHRLLMRIEDYIGDKTSPFITVDAITPVYEEVTVCCNLRIKPGYPVGDILRQTEARINNCIAPWRDKEEIPVFGLSFSSTDLYNSIRECEAIVDIDILSVAHVVYTAKDQQKSYYLNRYPEEARQNFNVSPSQPWCILVPSDRHLLYIDQKDELLEQLGLGYLGVGSNFIINK